MRDLMRTTLVGLVFAGLWGAVAAVEPPALLNYEGVLRDPNGVPRDGDFEMIFRFFDAATLGNEILVDAHVASGTGEIKVKGGLFNVQLGSGEVVDGSAPLPNDPYGSLSQVFRDFTEVWMEIQIGAETLAPRVRVVAAAYALNADHLDGKDASEYLDTSAAAQVKAGDLTVDAMRVSADLRVAGQVTISGGTPGAGKVLTSSPTGLATWQDLPAVQAESLRALADRLDAADPSELPFAALRSFDCSGSKTASLFLTIGAGSPGTVLGFVGADRISDTSEYLVAVERNDTTLNTGSLIGQDGRVILQRDGATTFFSGIVTEAGLAGWDGSTATYVIRLEPRLVRLARSSGYRTWQGQRASDIVVQLQAEAGYPGDVDATSHTLAWTIQYEETGLEFFNRLTEGEGIHYHFKEDVSTERLVARTTNGGFTSIPGTFNYYGDLQDPGTGEEFVATFRERDRTHTGTLISGGWDYLNKEIVLHTTTIPGGTGELREAFGDLSQELGGVAAALAQVRAESAEGREQLRRLERTGTGNVAHLKAGHVFSLTDLTTAGFGGSYVVTGIRHYALSDPAQSCVSYGNAFTAIASTVEYRPPRRTHPPRARGPIRAVVTNTMDPKRLGRVKVKLHMDPNNTVESGWVRIAVPSWRQDARIHLPDVDDEVLVDFVRNDPTAPVIIGSLYNGVDTPNKDYDNEIFMVRLSPKRSCYNDLDPNQTSECGQVINFFDDGEPDDEWFSWNDALDRFEISNDLAIGVDKVTSIAAGSLEGGALSVSGDVQAGSLTVSGNIQGAGNLDVVGQIKGASVNTGTGAITGGALTATLPSQFDSLLTVAGPVVAGGGTLSFSGSLFAFGGPLSVGGDADLSGDLDVGGGDITASTLNIAPTSTLNVSGSLITLSGIETRVTSRSVLRWMIDSDNNTSTSMAGWFRDGSYVNANKIAELQEDGDLLVRGSLTPFVSFDLAESFLASEKIEAGDLVRLDPAFPGAVRLTEAAGDPLVIGVVSETPGIVLGGGAFDPAALRSAWGQDVGEIYEQERPRLREEVLAGNDDLRRQLHEMESRGAFLAADLTGDTPSAAANAGRGPAAVEELEGEDAARREIEERIESRSLERFYEERFAPVALAGRVPVKADASHGAIEPGDPLTPGPVPGVAVKAIGPGPVIGTALEGLSGGRGKVLAFIDRGRYGAPAAVIPERTSHLEPAAAPDEVAGEAGRNAPPTAPSQVRATAADGAPFSIRRNDGAVGTPGAEVLRVDAEGNVYARGAFHPSSMDLAEYFPLSEPAEVGDVLVVDPEQPGLYGLGRRTHDPAVVGIVSGEPGVLLGSGIARIAAADAALAVRLEEARRLGDEDREEEVWAALRARFRETHAPVALSGTVLCKVDAGYGAIVPGDLLTTSPTPGHAMRADDPAPGTIVGKALEPLDDGMGTIRVLVMLR